MTLPLSYVETTHKVENQSRPLEPFDAYQSDAALREACAREAGPSAAWVKDLPCPRVSGAPASVAEAYCSGRLGDDRKLEYGGLPDGAPLDALIERALPA